MLIWVVGFYTLYVFLKIYLSIMQIGYINREKYRDAVILPKEKYLTAGNYAVSREKLLIVNEFVEYLLFLWWFSNGFKMLETLCRVDDTTTSSLLFILGFFAINFLISIPFSIYQKFKIDSEFGFNNMTPKMFVVDMIKSVIIFLVFGGVVFTLLIFVIENFISWWFWSATLLLGVILLINIIYPTLIAPIFNKFTPLDDIELKEKIEMMMKKVGLNSSGIFVMDASRRDTRLNAYFGGIGKSKRVVLFDTLIEKLSHKELLSVLGHELGHYKHKDIWKNMAVIGGLIFLALYIFGHLPQNLFIEIGVTPNGGTILGMIILLLPPITFFYTPIISFVSRHNEYEADRFGSEMGGKENLISALLKLVKENKAFPKSDPIYSKFYHTHPPILERIEALGFDVKKKLPREGIFQFLDES